MKKPANGMQMYHEQVNDRQKWHEAVAERKRLINRAELLGVKLKNPHNMKIKDIKSILLKEVKRQNEKYCN